jgi:hypothetical protein
MFWSSRICVQVCFDDDVACKMAIAIFKRVLSWSKKFTRHPNVSKARGIHLATQYQS